MTAGIKHDSDKVRLDLVPWRSIWGAATVFTYGAAKYSDRNWEKGIKYGRLYAALLRHLFAWWLGTERDVESDLSHLDHAQCCLMMLREMHQIHPELDDRPNGFLNSGSASKSD